MRMCRQPCNAAVAWVFLALSCSRSQHVIPETNVEMVREAALLFSTTHNLSYDDVWLLASYLTDGGLRPDDAQEALGLVLPIVLEEGPVVVLEEMRAAARALGLEDGVAVRTLASTYDLLRASHHDVLQLASDLRLPAEPRLYLLLKNSSARDYTTAEGKLYGVMQDLAQLRPDKPYADLVKYRFVSGPPEGSDDVVLGLWRCAQQQGVTGKLRVLLQEHGRSLAAYGGVGMARKSYSSDEQLATAYLSHVAGLDTLPRDYQRQVVSFLQGTTAAG